MKRKFCLLISFLYFFNHQLIKDKKDRYIELIKLLYNYNESWRLVFQMRFFRGGRDLGYNLQTSEEGV